MWESNVADIFFGSPRIELPLVQENIGQIVYHLVGIVFQSKDVLYYCMSKEITEKAKLKISRHLKGIVDDK